METNFEPGDKVVFYGQAHNYPYDVPPFKEEGIFIFHMTNESGMFNFPIWGVSVHLYFEDVLLKGSELKPDQIERILSMVENEGIEHVFLHKTDFEEIQCEEFHHKRKEFINAYTKFENYLNSLNEHNTKDS